MRHTLSKVMLAAPIAATAVLPITAFTSCNKKDQRLHHIGITNKDRAIIQIVKDKNLKERLEPQEFPRYLAQELCTRGPDFMRESLQEAFELSDYVDQEERFVECPECTDWDNDRITYTITPNINQDYDYVILFLHGGGYAKNINYIHINGCVELCDQLNAKVYVALHPVLPQHDYTECRDYLIDVYNYILEHEAGKKIVFLGDSSGAGLALAFSQYLYNMAEPLPYARVLFSPWVDVTMKNPEIDALVEDDIMLHPYGLAAYGVLWANAKISRDHFFISPINGEFDDKIKTIIFTGEKEILKPDAFLLHNKLLQHGCESELVLGEGLFHDFEFFNKMDAYDKVCTMTGHFLSGEPLE